ncbi:MAG: hypothetical protein IPH37_09095 [Burkholderiales bacterium]|nr:hypothetical protein [Burkholderiales bacterium]
MPKPAFRWPVIYAKTGAVLRSSFEPLYRVVFTPPAVAMGRGAPGPCRQQRVTLPNAARCPNAGMLLCRVPGGVLGWRPRCRWLSTFARVEQGGCYRGCGFWADNDLAIRFCHDRMQQVAYGLFTPEHRLALTLQMARRFAACHDDTPASALRAAQHYMQAAALVDDPAERARAQTLITNAARQARQPVLLPGRWKCCRWRLTCCHPSRGWVSQRPRLHCIPSCTWCCSAWPATESVMPCLKTCSCAQQPVALVEPACIQVVSLSNRTRYADAVALSAQLLAQLGVTLPAGDALVPAVLEELGLFYAYVQGGAFERLPQSAELTVPQQLAVGKLLSRTVPAAFFGQPLVSLWCILRGARLWADEGYFPEANYLMACVLLPAVAFGDDYANGYRAGRLSLNVGEARGQEAEVGRTRHVFALFNCHWFESLESAIEHARTARTVRRLGIWRMRASPSSPRWRAFWNAATGSKRSPRGRCCHRLCEKTGNRHARNRCSVQAAGARPGRQHHRTGGFDDADFSEAAHAQAVLANPMAHAFYRSYRALSACLFDDAPALIAHSQAAVELIPNITGFYPVALIQFLHALALLNQCTSATGPARLELLEGVAKAKAWLALRGADADMNFGHLHDAIEAEHLDALDQLASPAGIPSGPWRLQMPSGRGTTP